MKTKTIASLTGLGLAVIVAVNNLMAGSFHTPPRTCEPQCSINTPGCGYLPNQWRRWPGSEPPLEPTPPQIKSTLPSYERPNAEQEAEGPKGLPSTLGGAADNKGAGGTQPGGPAVPGSGEAPTNPFDIKPAPTMPSPFAPGGGIIDPRGNVPDKKPDMSNRWAPPTKNYNDSRVLPASANMPLPTREPARAADANDFRLPSSSASAMQRAPQVDNYRAMPTAMPAKPALTPETRYTRPESKPESFTAALPAADTSDNGTSAKRVRKNSLRED